MFDYSSFGQSQRSQNGLTDIHPTALVSREAKLAKGVSVGPNAIIGPKVTLAAGVKVGAGAIVTGVATVGEDTRIFPYATVGSEPQDLKYDGEETRVRIGKRNNIREYANISTGTSGGGGETTIGSDNLFMAFSHVGHDCHVGNHCVFANGVQLAGHVIVGNHTVVGGLAGLHQFCRFGDRSMIAAGSIPVQDVPPYCLVQGDRARIAGLNIVGLRRSGMSREEIADVKKMFKILYNENRTLEDAMTKIAEEVQDSTQKSTFLDFLSSSERGVCR